MALQDRQTDHNDWRHKRNDADYSGSERVVTDERTVASAAGWSGTTFAWTSLAARHCFWRSAAGTLTLNNRSAIVHTTMLSSSAAGRR
jgi:hypothetical protein